MVLDKKIFYVFPIEAYVSHVTPGTGPFMAHGHNGHNLNKFGRGCPCENEVGFIGTVLELSGTHFNGTFWDNHLIPINPNIGIIWY